jgi:phage recombination protein Bet
MNETAQQTISSTRAVTIAPARLPYHPALEERFGVGQAEWRALVDAIFPLARESESIILALSYCRARKLDPFKRVVHIVPMWNSDLGRMVETVWPGIGELRTTAFRTRQYAGRDGAQFGPTCKAAIGTVTMEYPEWCQITCYRVLDGQKYPFPGPRVYWMESYATTKKGDVTPNSMWRKRPFGQLDKCAEAAALRAAFPEEVGNDYTAEEMDGRTLGAESLAIAVAPERTLTAKLDAIAAGDPPHDPETGEVISNEDKHWEDAAKAEAAERAYMGAHPQATVATGEKIDSQTIVDGGFDQFHETAASSLAPTQRKDAGAAKPPEAAPASDHGTSMYDKERAKIVEAKRVKDEKART